MDNATTLPKQVTSRPVAQAFYSKNTYILLNTTQLNNKSHSASGLSLVTNVHNYLY